MGDFWWKAPASVGGIWTSVQRKSVRSSNGLQPRDFSSPALKRAIKTRTFARINAGAPTNNYALRENGVVEIEPEWTARDRELKMLGGPARTFLCPG